jgi:hypothetical protein
MHASPSPPLPWPAQLSGTLLSGSLVLGQRLSLGPNAQGEFELVTVRQLQRSHVQVGGGPGACHVRTGRGHSSGTPEGKLEKRQRTDRSKARTQGLVQSAARPLSLCNQVKQVRSGQTCTIAISPAPPNAFAAMPPQPGAQPVTAASAAAAAATAAAAAAARSLSPSVPGGWRLAPGGSQAAPGLQLSATPSLAPWAPGLPSDVAAAVTDAASHGLHALPEAVAAARSAADLGGPSAAAGGPLPLMGAAALAGPSALLAGPSLRLAAAAAAGAGGPAASAAAAPSVGDGFDGALAAAAAALELVGLDGTGPAPGGRGYGSFSGFGGFARSSLGEDDLFGFGFDAADGAASAGGGGAGGSPRAGAGDLAQLAGRELSGSDLLSGLDLMGPDSPRPNLHPLSMSVCNRHATHSFGPGPPVRAPGGGDGGAPARALGGGGGGLVTAAALSTSAPAARVLMGGRSPPGALSGRSLSGAARKVCRVAAFLRAVHSVFPLARSAPARARRNPPPWRRASEERFRCAVAAAPPCRAPFLSTARAPCFWSRGCSPGPAGPLRCVPTAHVHGTRAFHTDACGTGASWTLGGHCKGCCAVPWAAPQAVLILLGGHWPPRGLLSGRWPPAEGEEVRRARRVGGGSEGTAGTAGGPGVSVAAARERQGWLELRPGSC